MKKDTFTIISKILALLIILTGANMVYSQTELPVRNSIPNNYKWNLADLYDNDDLWESDYLWVETQLRKYKEFQGKLGSSAKTLLEFTQLNKKVMTKFMRIYQYAQLSYDLDLNVGKYQTMTDRMSRLSADLNASTSFVVPELIEIPKNKIDEFFKQEAELQQYSHWINNILRMKAHTLNASEEKILAQIQPIIETPRNAYNQLNDAELPFPTVKDTEGKDIKISHGRYRASLYSLDRDYRRRIYKGTYEPYNNLKGTMAALFNGRVKSRIIEAQLRNYESPRQMALDKDNIPMSVYDNLVNEANKNIATLHRWASIKKRYLKLDSLHPYDTYVTLFPAEEKKYTFDEAKELILEALKPLGEEYNSALRLSFDNRWIDVYETAGKRSGAYSSGCGCGVHPYILLNWNNTLDDVFTLAHELGHNMHSFFTEKMQPIHYTDYTIFVAEIASTTNEALLLDYMIQKSQSKQEKLALIEKYLINMQSTFFRQTRFAEFEMIVHDKALKGEILTADELTKLFAELYQKYWGSEMVTDYEEGLSWARIPHLFKYNFYVFQYSTGFSAAQAFAQQIKEEGKPAIDRYLRFLNTGASEYSIDMLKKAGVDMSSPLPIQKTIKKTNDYLDMLEELLKN